jgi:peptide deformylase
MAVREIVLMGDPILRTEAEEVTAFDDELRELVRDMFETMYHADGIGLAAPQIGQSARVLVIDLRREDHDDEQIAMVNPRLVWRSEETTKQSEGCLSIPGLEEIVERAAEVRVEGSDPEGNPISLAAEDLLSRALQHEIDHLDGILFVDHLSPLKKSIFRKKYKKLMEQQQEQM